MTIFRTVGFGTKANEDGETVIASGVEIRCIHRPYQGLRPGQQEMPLYSSTGDWMFPSLRIDTS